MRISLRILLVMLLPSAALAEIAPQEIQYNHGEVQLRGLIAYDRETEGKRPGILVVHEWWGLNDYARQRAQELAELGYVAFALDMYGDGRTTDKREEAQQLAGEFYQDRALMRGRAAAGLEVLRRHEAVDASQIIVIGYCFGGTVALELARSGAEVVGAVSFHGGLGTPTPEDAAKIKGKVLVLTGAVDPMVPMEEIRGFVKEMEDASVDYQLVMYGGAVHSFTNPGADAHGIPGVAHQPAAERRSWVHMRMFFDEVFGEGRGRR